MVKQGVVARSASQKPYCHLLLVQDIEGEGSGDLLSRSLVHANERDGVDYVRQRSTEEEANPRLISRLLRGGGSQQLNLYRDIRMLDQEPAQSLLRITEPDKSHVTYLDSTPFHAPDIRSVSKTN